MITVIPAILCKNEEEFVDKINKIKNLAQWAQVDVMDGKFVPQTTINNPLLIKKFSNLNFEIHLMVIDPQNYIDPWIEAGAKRIIFHIEATEQPEQLIDRIKNLGVQATVAINPETPLEKITPLLDKINMVMLMGNNPGKQGQPFQYNILNRAQKLKKINPNLPLEVDVGVNEKTAPRIKQAGISNLVSGSFLFGHSDIEQAINILKNN